MIDSNYYLCLHFCFFLQVLSSLYSIYLFLIFFIINYKIFLFYYKKIKVLFDVHYNLVHQYIFKEFDTWY